MHYTASVAVGTPMTRFSSSPSRRAIWMTFIVVLTVLIAAAAFVVGSSLLRNAGPDRHDSGVLMPTLALDETWDATVIPGLSLPSGMDIGPDGNLYVVNAGAGEIVVLDPSGKVVRRWGEPGSGPGQFLFHGDTQDPLHAFGGVAVTPDGSV